MKVFISHAHTDTELAKRVAEVLRDAGQDVWSITEDVLPGENWGAKLAEALQESDAMVVLLTPDSVRSPNVTYEIGYALGKEAFKGRVIPVIAAPPDQLSPEEIPWILNRFHVIHLSTEERDEENLKRIAQALAAAA